MVLSHIWKRPLMTDSADNESESPCGRFVRITTGARLHFGLLSTMEPFGGVGAIIDQPATQVEVSESGEFQCNDNQQADRIRKIAESISRIAGLSELPPCKVTVTARPSSHCGLGSGTQLSLAIAEALCQFIALDASKDSIAIEIADRGKRSAIGVHGYFHGGLIYEDSSIGTAVAKLNPICQRVALPESWSVVIVRPTEETSSVSGDFEREKFATLQSPSEKQIEELRSCVSERMMPAAQGQDFSAFAEAVQVYNHASGMLFDSVQGGPYNGQAVANLVNSLIDSGAQGVGQSSWGPGVFCWFESRLAASEFVNSLTSDVEVLSISHPRAAPRSIEAAL